MCPIAMTWNKFSFGDIFIQMHLKLSLQIKMESSSTLTALDYSIFSVIIVISLGIGIYFSYKGQKTTTEFIVAGRQMKVFFKKLFCSTFWINILVTYIGFDYIVLHWVRFLVIYLLLTPVSSLSPLQISLPFTTIWSGTLLDHTHSDFMKFLLRDSNKVRKFNMVCSGTEVSAKSTMLFENKFDSRLLLTLMLLWLMTILRHSKELSRGGFSLFNALLNGTLKEFHLEEH